MLIYNALQAGGERNRAIDCQAQAAGTCPLRRAPAARDAGVEL